MMKQSPDEFIFSFSKQGADYPKLPPLPLPVKTGGSREQEEKEAREKEAEMPSMSPNFTDADRKAIAFASENMALRFRVARLSDRYNFHVLPEDADRFRSICTNLGYEFLEIHPA